MKSAQLKTLIVPIALLVVAMAAVGLSGRFTLESSDTELTFETAPEPLPSGTFDTIDGGQISFADIEGQDTVLWFWAPW